jgi:hypothetical protein
MTPMLKVSWRQALAWRMRRQLLDPVGTLPLEAVVRQLCGIQAQVASSAELAVRVRQATSRSGEVAASLAKGRLIKTWAMRGTLHLLTPEEGGAFLSLLAAGRSWERPSWVKAFGMSPTQLERFRYAVREVLDERVLTREELIAAVVARPGLDHVGEALRSGWGTLLKPLAWHGDLCFGLSQGNRVTFMRPDQASARWAGVPDPDEAAPMAIIAYLRAYGPATSANFGNWLSRGRVSARQLKAWFAGLGERLATVEVDGETAFILAEDADELGAARPTDALRLLSGFDQYVLGPGTEDHHIVPAGRRTAVSRQAGWISPVVVLGGIVSGTWEATDDEIRVAWFRETGSVPRKALEAETTRLSAILGRDLGVSVRLT